MSIILNFVNLILMFISFDDFFFCELILNYCIYIDIHFSLDNEIFVISKLRE